MILLYAQQTAIITLPKTGSTALFETLCRVPYRGVFCIGPSGNDPKYYDHHSIILPQAPFKWKVVVVVRHPLQRLVSLWAHMAKEQVMTFQPVTQLKHFVDAVANEWYEFYFYRSNQCDIIKDLEYDYIIKNEFLEDHLINLKILQHKGQLLSSNQFDPGMGSSTPKYQDVLTVEMIEKLKNWWEPDAKKFNYKI